MNSTNSLLGFYPIPHEKEEKVVVSWGIFGT